MKVKKFLNFVNECNVCGANVLINGETLKTVASNGDEYEIKGSAESAEFKPGKYQLRKMAENGQTNLAPKIWPVMLLPVVLI